MYSLVPNIEGGGGIVRGMEKFPKSNFSRGVVKNGGVGKFP